jgi:hypothetical protein
MGRWRATEHAWLSKRRLEYEIDGGMSLQMENGGV